MQLILYQKKYQWEKADKALLEVENPILIGHFQYEKLMHPNKYRASYKELSDWFRKNIDYPPVLRNRIYYLLIKRLPDINKKANTLSYGQKQRVLIARALYDTNKSVYIFDEYLSPYEMTLLFPHLYQIFPYSISSLAVPVLLSVSLGKSTNFPNIVPLSLPCVRSVHMVIQSP